MADSFHLNFKKTIGHVDVESHGGGSPRCVSIARTDRDDMAIANLSMEQARDLRYALDRLLTLCGDD